MLAEIGARWLRDGTAGRLLDWQRRTLARRNVIASNALEGLDHAGNPRGLHVWLRHRDPQTFVEKARAAGVAVAPGSAFAVDLTQDLPSGVRICLGGPGEDELRRALGIIASLANGVLDTSAHPL